MEPTQSHPPPPSMGGPPPPVPEPLRRPKIGRRKLLAVVAAVAVILGGFAIWQIVRPRTIVEVLSMDHLPAGGEIALQGTITGISRENTSYGPRVYLRLDDNKFCGGTEPWTGNLLADPNGSYRIGDSYRTALHPQAFRLNGDAAVWVPALACPFPALHRSIGVVLDAISQVRDMQLLYNGTDVGGWSHYEIRTQAGSSPDVLPVVLLKALPVSGTIPELPAGSPIDSANRWTAVINVFYLTASGALGTQALGFSIEDRMTSLAAATSANGTLRFVDVDANGLVNSGDRLDVRLPSTGSPNTWYTYLVRIGNLSAMAPPGIAGVHVILAGPVGPLEVLLSDRKSVSSTFGT